ncbi:MAG: hypothetical protein ACOYNR_12520 [Blastocatellia bacterium]|jgi:hypothetical protein
MRKSLTLLRRLGGVLIDPVYPPLSLSITESHLTLLSLRYQRGEFEPQQVAILPLPAGLVTPDFVRPNIAEEGQFRQILERLPIEAGLKKVGRLSVSLPSMSGRSHVLSLESAPRSRSEEAQLLDWKIERTAGYPTSELRVSQCSLPVFDGRPHWLVSLAHQAVLSQYESIFDQLGWQAGLIVPRHLAELFWLTRAKVEGDQMLVTPTSRGFEVVLLHGSTPLLVREVDCTPEEVENEFYRLVVFYRDRLISSAEPSSLFRLLVTGSSADQQRYRDLAVSALERPVVSLTPAQLGFRLDPGMVLSQVVAAAGLATCAWPS